MNASPLNTAREKFSVGVIGMAVGLGGIRERIAGAHHSFKSLSADNFKGHPEIQKKFETLMSELTKLDDPAKGSAKETLSAMSDEEAQDVARQICEIDFQIRWAVMGRR